MELTAEYSRHLFCRGVDLNLFKILETLPSPIRHLHLYCVNLNHSGGVENGSVRMDIPQTSELRYIHIFTCTFLDQASIETFKIISSNQLKLEVHFERIPPKLMFSGPGNQNLAISRDDPRSHIETQTLSTNGSSGINTEKLKGEIPSQLDAAIKMDHARDMVGFRITQSSSGATFEPLSRVRAGEFAKSGLLTFATGATAQDARYALGNLPFLLNYVFASACRLVFQGLSASDPQSKDDAEQMAMDYLSFIRRCTSSCPEYSALHQDASTLLQRLELPRRYPGPFESQDVIGKYIVPPESPSKYEDYLKEAIARCKDVQHSLDDLILATTMTKELKKDNSKALEALSSLALGTVPNDQYYKAMDDSFKTVAKCKKGMQDRETQLKVTQTTFKENFEVYKQNKKDARDRAMWIAAGELAVSVIIVCCTGNPAAALPALVHVTAIVAETAQQAQTSEAADEKPKVKAPEAKTPDVKKLEVKTTTTPTTKSESKTSDIAKKAGTAAVSAGNKMYQAWQTYEKNLIIKTEAEAIRRQSLDSKLSAAADAASGIISASSPPMDYFGLMADWEEMKVQVNEMFNVLKFNLGSDTIKGLEEYQSALSNMIIRGKALIDAQRQLQENIGAYLRGIAESAIRAKREAAIKKAAQDIMSDSLPTQGHIDELNASLVVLKRAAVLRLHQYLLRLKYYSSSYNDISINASPDMSVDQLDNVRSHLRSQVEQRGNGSQNRQDVPLLEFSTNDDKDCNIFVSEWKSCLNTLREIPFEISYKNSAGARYCDLRIAKISAQFLRRDGRPFTKVGYDISLGPVLIDRDSDGKLHQFYADQFLIRKIDDQGEWVSASQTDSDAKILPALFTSGIIDLGSTDMRNIELEEVVEVKLVVLARGTPCWNH